jgi:cytochrome c biogenesis protein CcmG/thiol:disulfide interchange protein DsbE
MTERPPETEHDGRDDPHAGPGRRRRRIVIGVVVVFLVLVGSGLAAVLSTSGTITQDVLTNRTGQPARAFSLAELSAPARTVSLSDFRGEGLVVNFWASWCTPCQMEMPLLESAYRSEHGRVTFLGIDSNDMRGSAISFLHRVHATYPTLFDPHGAVANAYGLFGLPTTIFISREGKILGRHIGQFDSTTLQAALRAAFGAQNAP